MKRHYTVKRCLLKRQERCTPPCSSNPHPFGFSLFCTFCPVPTPKSLSFKPEARKTNQSCFSCCRRLARHIYAQTSHCSKYSGLIPTMCGFFSSSARLNGFRSFTSFVCAFSFLRVTPLFDASGTYTLGSWDSSSLFPSLDVNPSFPYPTSLLPGFLQMRSSEQNECGSVFSFCHSRR